MGQKLDSETRARTLMIGDAQFDGGVLKGGHAPPLHFENFCKNGKKLTHFRTKRTYFNYNLLFLIFTLFFSISYFSHCHYFSEFRYFSLFYTISVFFSIFHNGEWWREWKQIVAMFCKQCHSNGKSSHMRKNS